MKAMLSSLSSIVFGLFAAGYAQQTTQPDRKATATPQDTVVRIFVNLVQVDAVVTDSKDRQVTDLQAEDFEIFQDGRKH